MAPLDMCGGGGGGGGGGNSCGGGGGVASFEHSRAVDRRPSCEDASSAKEESQEPSLADTAGERRKSRAAKLRQTRSRNAARIQQQQQQQQVYTSAEDSEEEVRKEQESKGSPLPFASVLFFPQLNTEKCAPARPAKADLNFFDW